MRSTGALDQIQFLVDFPLLFVTISGQVPAKVEFQ